MGSQWESFLTASGLDEDGSPSENLWLEDGFLFFRPPRYAPHELRQWGGRWIKDRRAWKLPKLVSIARKCYSFGAIRETEEVRAWMRVQEKAFDPGRREEAPDDHPWNRLRGYQREAVYRLATTEYRGNLLALSPGLGKTPVSIVAAELVEAKRILVVAPKPLLETWRREIDTWALTNGKQIAHGESPDPNAKWVITNYETVLRRPGYDIEWDIVILDESIKIKNRRTKRYQRLLELAGDWKRVWLLSGAPVVRGNEDLWTQLRIIEPRYFTSFWRFVNEYCIVEETPWGRSIVGSKDVSMREEFPDLIFARSQDEVLSELPDFIFRDVDITLTRRQQKVHKDLIDQWISELDGGELSISVPNVIAQITRLQQVTSNLKNLITAGGVWPDESAKADTLLELLEEGEIEFPLLVWTHWKPGANALGERLKTAGYNVDVVHGDTSNQNERIEAYKNGETDILVLSLGVGRYGHHLINTKTVVYLDKSWDADAYFQSLHRTRRYGLEHRPVVINLRARGTIDDFVELNLAGKLPSISRVTGTQLARMLRSLGQEHVNWEEAFAEDSR